MESWEITDGFTNVITYDYTYTTGADTTVQSNYLKALTYETPWISGSVNYSYDNNGNISQYISAWDGGSSTIGYVYDSANQLIRENNSGMGSTWVWTYDNAGNILSSKKYSYTTAADLSGLTPAESHTYTYGDEDWGDLLTAYDGTTITYDAIGNPLSDGTWTYTWEHGRQLKSMSNGSTTWNYTYDASGMRKSRTNGSVTYSYVYNGDQLTQMTKGNDTLYFTYGSTGPVSVTWNGTTYYYVVNAQGDVIGIMEHTGDLAVEYRYNAWGEVTYRGYEPELAELNPLRYRGYVYDTETGLYYVSSRYYDPEIGRWISPEPNVYNGEFDEAAGLLGYNVYAYCANNPVMYADSDGEGILLAMAIGAGVGALISGVIKVYQNYKSGRNWYKDLAISMLAGGIGGAISCISIPGVSTWVCAAVFGAAGNLTTKVILGEIKSIGDLTSAITVGAGAGLLGNAASKLLIKGVTKYFGTLTKASQKAFLSRIGQITNAQLKAIRQQVSKGLTPAVLEQLVQKYGYDVLVSAFVSSTAASAK